MKKQDDNSLPSSSSRRENSPKTTLHAKGIGCMSGIFHLVYSYNTRRGKFLTFGKKQQKNTVSSSSQQDQNTFVSSKVTRFSCNVPRSPTLSAEIRRSNTGKSPENLRTTPLVGLDNVDRATDLTAESTAEKRMKLLEALEKCDKDLKALKKIIDVVKSSVGVEDNEVNGGDYQKGLTCKQHTDQLNVDLQLQPSPVSVLDDFTPPSALNGYSRRYTNGRAMMQQQQKQKQKGKPGEEEDNITNIYLAEKIASNGDESSDIILQAAKMSENAIISPSWGSKAMIDSVNQVCRDMAWGERREIGRLGLALQDFICRDLIEEIVMELIGSFSVCMYSLPFQACQRSLRF